MNTIQQQRLALRLAAAILIRHGEVSPEDIRSFPFVSEDLDVDSIINALARLYNTELLSSQIATSPFPRWEETIILKTS